MWELSVGQLKQAEAQQTERYSLRRYDGSIDSSTPLRCARNDGGVRCAYNDEGKEEIQY
jgi:hypothetical protein